MPNNIAGTLRVPNQNGPRTVSMAGGALGGITGTGLTTLVIYGGHMTYPSTGGATTAKSPLSSGARVVGGTRIGGAATIYTYAPKRKAFFGTGGALLGGNATETQIRPNINAALTAVAASLAPPAFFNYINGRFSAALGNTATTQSGDTGIAAPLTLLDSTFTVAPTTVALVTAELPVITCTFKGGPQAIAAKLTVLQATFAAFAGEVGIFDAPLPSTTATLDAAVGTSATIISAVPVLTTSLTGLTGGLGAITAVLPRSSAALVSLTGASGTITAKLPIIEINATAGLGAVGTIDTRLTTVSAIVTVLANATTQQLVMVVNTVTNTVSTYENFPYNGFFELGGKFYATGTAGLVQIDTGNTDNGALINAGLSTGLWDLKSDFQKSVSDAYLTARMSGNMTVTTTVDEGARYAASSVVLDQLNVSQLVQRRVPLARGLRGKSWQFEFNNVAGADFDFGNFGVNLDVSTRRIQGAHNG